MFSVIRFGRLGTPITQLLKSISGTPCTLGAPTVTPGEAGDPPGANPRLESVVPVPPSGWLNFVSSRKYPNRNSFTAAEEKVFVFPRSIVCVCPLLSTLNPGYNGAFEAQ